MLRGKLKKKRLMHMHDSVWTIFADASMFFLFCIIEHAATVFSMEGMSCFGFATASQGDAKIECSSYLIPCNTFKTATDERSESLLPRGKVSQRWLHSTL